MKGIYHLLLSCSVPGAGENVVVKRYVGTAGDTLDDEEKT